MTLAPTTVSLVLDPAFGERLAELDPAMPIWVLESAQNSPVVDRLRKSGGRALTLLIRMPDESERDLTRRALANINEHHGRAGGHPYGQLRLLGVEPQAIPSEILDELSLELDPAAAGVVLVPRHSGG